MPYLCVLVFFVFFAGVAMTIGEGLWNNFINFMALACCSTLAAAVGPALGAFAIDKFGKTPDMMWFFSFAGIWLVFFASIMVFRILLERLSKVRMRFVPPLEMVAGPLMGLVVSVLFASFLAFTLYTTAVRSGEWQLPTSGWQYITMRTGAGPFYTLLSSTLGEDAAMEYFTN